MAHGQNSQPEPVEEINLAQTSSGEIHSEESELPPLTVEVMRETLRLEQEGTKLVDLSQYTDEELRQALQWAQEINWDDINVLLLFGSKPQQDLNAFLDQMLADIKVAEAGPIGDLTVQLAKGISETKVREFQDQMQRGRKWFLKVPVLGAIFSNWFDYAKIFFSRQKNFKDLIDQIEETARGRNDELMRRNIQLDKLYDRNEETHHHVGLWLIAGEAALEIGKRKLVDLKKKADESNVQSDAEKVRDFNERLTSFEVRLSDMKTAYLRASVSGPQIRTVQKAAEIEMQNITRSLLNDAPALKQAIVMAAANYSIIQAQAEGASRRSAVKEIETLNADLTGQAYTTAKKSQGQALDDATHIADIASRLLGAMEKGVQIEQENKEKRAEAARILGQTQRDLVAGLKKIEAADVSSQPTS